MKIKNWITSNVGFITIMLFAMLMVFNPSAKAWVITGLMKIGLFQPDVEEASEGNNQEYDALLPDGIIVTDKNGQQINLSAQKGKVLFINFWATWCPPCIAEMPAINDLYKRFSANNNVLFLMVDVDGSLPEATKFMTKNKYVLPAYSPASSIPSSVLDGSIPTTLVVNKQGKIVFHHTGGADYSDPGFIKFLENQIN